MLEKEEWRYDKFPEFYNGSNVLDFYDPDITEKLDALEKEEEELLKMEGMQDDLMGDEEIDGIKTSELKLSLKEVRAKKAIFKMEHKLKIKRTHTAKQHDLTDVIEHMESKGIPVNKESFAATLRSAEVLRILRMLKIRKLRNFWLTLTAMAMSFRTKRWQARRQKTAEESASEQVRRVIL